MCNLAAHFGLFSLYTYVVAKLCLVFCDPMDIASQTPVSIEFSRQECRNRLPFPPPRHLPYPGIWSLSLTLAGGFFASEPPGKPILMAYSSHSPNLCLLSFNKLCGMYVFFKKYLSNCEFYKLSKTPWWQQLNIFLLNGIARHSIHKCYSSIKTLYTYPQKSTPD